LASEKGCLAAPDNRPVLLTDYEKEPLNSKVWATLIQITPHVNPFFHKRTLMVFII
jgi:hypothetical protein